MHRAQIFSIGAAFRIVVGLTARHIRLNIPFGGRVHGKLQCLMKDRYIRTVKLRIVFKLFLTFSNDINIIIDVS